MKVRRSYCNSEVESTAKFCPNCGHEMNQIFDIDSNNVGVSRYENLNKNFEQQIRDDRRRKSLVWGIVTVVCLVAIISNAICMYEFDSYGFGAAAIFMSLILFIMGLILSLMYARGIIKSAQFNGHTIVFESSTRNHVYLDGKLISKTYAPSTVYVQLSSDTTIAVIPKLGCWNQYGGTITDVDFVRVYR